MQYKYYKVLEYRYYKIQTITISNEVALPDVDVYPLQQQHSNDVGSVVYGSIVHESQACLKWLAES